MRVKSPHLGVATARLGRVGERPVGVGTPSGQEREEFEPVPALVEVEVRDEHGGSSRGARTRTRPYGSEMNELP